MGASYSPNHFLRQVPNNLIAEYLSSKGVDPKIEIENIDKEGLKTAEIINIADMVKGFSCCNRRTQGGLYQSSGR